MWELRARFVFDYLSRFFLLVFGPLEFFLVTLPLFVLVLLALLVFAHLCLSLVLALIRLVSDERTLCISRALRRFDRRLYIRRLCA
jgi:hypothetical protein